MTNTDPLHGRDAATLNSPFRNLRMARRLLGCALLLGTALPAFAQQAPLAQAATLAAASTLNTQALGASDLAAAKTLEAHPGVFGPDVNRAFAAQPPTIPTATVATVAPTGSRIQNLLQHALALLGTPYRWGGTGTGGFDCSGLVGYVFHSALGIELPRVSRDMATSGQLVSDRANLSPGDLVFFGRKGRVSHVGIYVGEGRFLHAPRTGRDVTVSSLDSGYWSDKYLEARRVAGI